MPWLSDHCLAGYAGWSEHDATTANSVGQSWQGPGESIVLRQVVDPPSLKSVSASQMHLAGLIQTGPILP